MKRTLTAGLALAAIAGPAFAQDERPMWNLYVDAEMATLSYAIPESDDGGPTLLCEIGRGHNTTPGRLTAYYFTENRVRGRQGVIRLRSGEATANVTARVETNEESGGSELTGPIPITSPVIAAFARTGRISFAVGADTNAPPAAPVAKVARLLAACRR